MTQWMGREYNYEIWTPSHAELKYLRTEIPHAGDRGPDFTLPRLTGRDLTPNAVLSREYVS